MKNRILAMSLFAMTVLCLGGCAEQKKVTPTYTGSVKVVRVNGEVTEVEVSLPGHTTIKINNREDANTLITHLESLATELKASRDQFKVQETATSPSGK
jgi:hypothetical protein